MLKEGKQRKYIGFYVDEEIVNKLSFISGALYNNNRSDYLNQVLKKAVANDYEKAIEQAKNN